MKKLLSANSQTDVLGFDVSEKHNVVGTSLQGTIQTTYDKLVEIFGKPTYTDADPYEKVACEWVMKVAMVDRPIFTNMKSDILHTITIYSWKLGRIPTEQYDWHIGGKTGQVVEIVESIINNHKFEKRN